jgi:hypothetical protein
MALVHKRTIPTEGPPFVGEVSATFLGLRVSCGQHNGSPRPYSRISIQATYTKDNTNAKQTHTNIHASSGIGTHDLSVGADEDSSCLRSRGHCDRMRHSAHLVIPASLRVIGSVSTKMQST